MQIGADTLIRQSNQIFATLEASVGHCPEETLWVEKEGNMGSIGMIAIHAIEPMIQMLSSDDVERADQLRHDKDKSELLQAMGWLREEIVPAYITSGDLAEPDEFPQYFISRLDRLMKFMRHVAQHTGEINQQLRDLGIPRGKFIQM